MVWQCKPTIFMILSRGEGGKILPEKLGRGVRPSSQNPYPIYDQTLRFFATLFITWPKTRYSIYDRCGWHSCPKYKLWRAFVDGLVDNDEQEKMREHIPVPYDNLFTRMRSNPRYKLGRFDFLFVCFVVVVVVVFFFMVVANCNASRYCRFSHDVTKIQTTKLLILLTFYFHNV